MKIIPSFTIKANDASLPGELMASIIKCTSHIDHHSTAEITFLCPTNEANDASNLITKIFAYNTEVTIEAGYDLINKTIFTGVVSAQGVIKNDLNNLFVIITCKGNKSVINNAIPYNSVVNFTYGENIMGLNLSTNKNSTAVLPADSLYETTGILKLQGTSRVDAGDTISLSNIGDSFNKRYLVTSTINQIADGDWITEAHLAFKESILA